MKNSQPNPIDVFPHLHTRVNQRAFDVDNAVRHLPKTLLSIARIRRTSTIPLENYSRITTCGVTITTLRVVFEHGGGAFSSNDFSTTSIRFCAPSLFLGVEIRPSSIPGAQLKT